MRIPCRWLSRSAPSRPVFPKSVPETVFPKWLGRHGVTGMEECPIEVGRRGGTGGQLPEVTGRERSSETLALGMASHIDWSQHILHRTRGRRVTAITGGAGTVTRVRIVIAWSNRAGARSRSTRRCTLAPCRCRGPCRPSSRTCRAASAPDSARSGIATRDGPRWCRPCLYPTSPQPSAGCRATAR